MWENASHTADDFDGAAQLSQLLFLFGGYGKRAGSHEFSGLSALRLCVWLYD